MPVDGFGQRWACYSCIRGHRAPSCQHFERWMLAVKRPGRPSNCPHRGQVCDCDTSRMVIMMAIPRKKPCQCKPAVSKSKINGQNGRSEGDEQQDLEGNDGIENDIQAKNKEKEKEQEKGKAKTRKKGNECSCTSCSCVYETRVNIQDLDKAPQLPVTILEGLSMQLQQNGDRESNILDIGLQANDSFAFPGNSDEEASRDRSLDNDSSNNIRPVEERDSNKFSSNVAPSKSCCSQKQHQDKGPRVSMMPVNHSDGFDARTSSFDKMAGTSLIDRSLFPYKNDDEGCQTLGEVRPTIDPTLSSNSNISTVGPGEWGFPNMDHSPVYAYPPGEATLGNPMTMQRMYDLQQREVSLDPNHAALSETGNLIGTDGYFLPPEQQSYNVATTCQHHCNCGPGCQCSGCAAHPFNQTSMQEIQDGYLLLKDDHTNILTPDQSSRANWSQPSIHEPSNLCGSQYAGVNSPFQEDKARIAHQYALASPITAPISPFNLMSGMNDDDYFVYQVSACDQQPWTPATDEPRDFMNRPP